MLFAAVLAIWGFAPAIAYALDGAADEADCEAAVPADDLPAGRQDAAWADLDAQDEGADVAAGAPSASRQSSARDESTEGAAEPAESAIAVDETAAAAPLPETLTPQEGATAAEAAAASRSPSAQSDMVLEAASATDEDTAEAAGALPARFDLRDLGVVSPVKQQDPWGTCWGFAVMAASEASILSDLGLAYEDCSLELSPGHMVWFAGTALPDAATMGSLVSHMLYASQATEGATVLSSSTNPWANPMENGGFSFIAALMFASGAGPVYLYQVPYKNAEDMATYSSGEPTGQIAAGQTLEQFLAQHPGEDFHSFMVLDENGTATMFIDATTEATRSLIDQGVLAHYAQEPGFDASGYPVTAKSPTSPAYDWSVDEALRFTRAFELLEYHALPQTTGGYEGTDYRYDADAVQAIKRELMAGRGVTVSVYDDSLSAVAGRGKYTNDQTWSQYTVNWDQPGKIYGSGHAVCIVGWDDNWGVENFLSSSVTASDGTVVSLAPPGPGAWIVKNSYGNEGAGFPNEGNVGYVDPVTGKHTGYFYLSYYDMSITYPASFVFDVTGHVSDHIYQHDFMPAPVAHTERFAEQTVFANVFTAVADQMVHSLSVEAEEPNTHAKLQLWLLRDGAESPVDGELIATVEATFEWGGFYRLKLDSPCLVRKGQRFSVVGVLTTLAQDGALTYHVPVHRDVNELSVQKYGAAITSYAKGVVNAGESLLLVDGQWLDWADLVSEWTENGRLVWYYAYDNFSLKAYADACTPEPVPDASANAEGSSNESPVPRTTPSRLPATGDPLSVTLLALVALASAALAAASAPRKS